MFRTMLVIPNCTELIVSYRNLSLRTYFFVRTYRIALHSQLGTVLTVLAELYRTALTYRIPTYNTILADRSNVPRRANRIETHILYRIIAVSYHTTPYRTLGAPFRNVSHRPYRFSTYRTVSHRGVPTISHRTGARNQNHI